jgi:hypothetical protein
MTKTETSVADVEKVLAELQRAQAQALRGELRLFEECAERPDW